MKHLITLLALGIPVAGSAQPNPEALHPMIVTATRNSIAADEALVPVIVIDRNTIANSGAIDLADLLRFHAGLDVARNGGPGQTTSVFFRGTESNHTLVLMDGVEINPGTIGGAAVQNISAAVIERVEIVKGPRSTLYGSEAIGGVINVITRKGSDGHLELQAGTGSYDSSNLNASGGLRSEHGEIGLTYNQFMTGGYPTQTGSDIDRAHRNTSVALNAGTRVGALNLGLRHWQATGNTEYLDFFLSPVEQDFRNRSTALSVGFPERGAWSSQLTLSRSVDDIEQQQSADFVRTERDTLDWQNDIRLDHHQLVAGITASREDTTGLSFGAPLDDGDGDGDVATDVFELYAADNIALGRHNVLLATRLTDHETFGNHTTWNAEYGFDVRPETRFSVTAGTAFRAPDSTDRFGFGGNRDLQPETATNIELGVRHEIGTAHSFGLQWFHNDIDDLIEYVVTDFVTYAGENRNVARARIRGLEANYEFAGSDWDLRVSAIVQDPENRDTGATLLRRAKRSVSGSIQRRLGAHRVGLDFLLSGKREDFGFPAQMELGEYELVNLNGRLALGPNWSLSGRIENLLDEAYETAAGFPNPGRGVYVQIGYSLTPRN